MVPSEPGGCTPPARQAQRGFGTRPCPSHSGQPGRESTPAVQIPQVRKHRQGAAEGLRGGYEQKKPRHNWRLHHLQPGNISRHSENTHPSSSPSFPSIPARPLTHHVTELLCAPSSHQARLKAAAPSPGRSSHPNLITPISNSAASPAARSPSYHTTSISPCPGATRRGQPQGTSQQTKSCRSQPQGVQEGEFCIAVREAPQTQPSKGLTSIQAHLPHTTAWAPQEQHLKMFFWPEGDAYSLCYPSISHPVPS